MKRVEEIELANREKRVVAVTMPCDIPGHLFNVEQVLMRGRIPITDSRIPDLRQGIFANFKISQGPFVVQFNDGTTAQ